jgi:transposase
MEDVLEVYHRSYAPKKPVICMDESNKQLISSTRDDLPMAPGKPLRKDDEYVRHGVANIFMAMEPIAGMRFVSLTERRTRIDWAEFIKDILDNKYPEADKIVLIMDNLNTHGKASLYEAFSPEESFRLASRLEIHYTPKHGSWLNMAECELSALVGQCLDRRIPDIETMRAEVAAWENDRNNSGANITWRFTTDEARVKLRRLYPQI